MNFLTKNDYTMCTKKYYQPAQFYPGEVKGDFEGESEGYGEGMVIVKQTFKFQQSHQLIGIKFAEVMINLAPNIFWFVENLIVVANYGLF